LLRLASGTGAAAYDGPFVLDRTHPLTEGLALQGVVWGAGRDERDRGSPVVLAGNVPLLTDAGADGRHRLCLYLRPELSTLPDAPAWPVLLWNLVRWRADHLPGAARPNLRLGENAALTFAVSPGTAEVEAPDGSKRTLPVAGRRLAVPCEQVGVHRVRAG